jgi:site-specific DNA recombinase
MAGAHAYGCSNARNRGTCNNRLTIRGDVIEASVPSGLSTHLMEPEFVKEFVAEFREVSTAAYRTSRSVSYVAASNCSWIFHLDRTAPNDLRV